MPNTDTQPTDTQPAGPAAENAAAPDEPRTTPPTTPRWRRPSARWSGGVFLLALLAMVAIYHQLWADPAHRILGSAGHTNDPMQMMWNLKWVPWAIGHGHNPFHTTAIYYPDGVSLSWNTAVPTLAALAAPLTFTAGPVFTFAVLITLGPALTTLTAFWWLRRHTTRPDAALVGAFVVGFSPFMAGHMLGHLNLVFAPLLPLALLLLEDLLWRHPRPGRRTALYLGLVAAAQIGISEELLIIVALAVLIALAFAALWVRGVGAALVRAARPLGAAILLALALASPLLIDQLFVSRSLDVRGDHWRATFGDYLYTLGNQAFGLVHPHVTDLGGAEDGVYLGPVLIAVLVVGLLLTMRRDRPVRIAAASLILLVLLSFGSKPGPVVLPWRLLANQPGFSSILPGRFSFASSLVIAWLLTRWLAALLERLGGHRGHPSTARVRIAAGLALAAIAAGLVMIVPATRGATEPPPATPFFGSAAERSLLPAGAPILLLPSAYYADASGMYYQAQADFRFRQPGGYALRPIPHGNSAGPPPSPLVTLAMQARTGVVAGPSELAAGRAQLVAQRYRAIVVVDAAPRAAAMAALARALTGRGPDRQVGGVDVWLLPGG